MNTVKDYLQERIARGLDEPISRHGGGPVDPPPGPPHDGDMTMPTDRLAKLEHEVHAIKGSLDWAKVLFAFLGAVMLGGFAILFNQIGGLRADLLGSSSSLRTETAGAISSLRTETAGAFSSLRTETAGAFSSLRTDLAAEARATRAELSATTSAIANSITATRQQAPQVILVPAPTTPTK